MFRNASVPAGRAVHAEGGALGAKRGFVGHGAPLDDRRGRRLQVRKHEIGGSIFEVETNRKFC